MSLQATAPKRKGKKKGRIDSLRADSNSRTLDKKGISGIGT